MQSDQNNRPDATPSSEGPDVEGIKQAVDQQARDIAEVPAVELINTVAVHLMSAAAVKTGLADDPEAEALKDLDEARKLITALAGLVTAAAPEVEEGALLRSEAIVIPSVVGHMPNRAHAGWPRSTRSTACGRIGRAETLTREYRKAN